MEPEVVESLEPGDIVWRYLGYFLVAGCAPVVGSFLIRKPVAEKFFGNISHYHYVFDAAFEEIWPEKYQQRGKEKWITVDTVDGRSFQGSLVWRSTSSMPPQLILRDAMDITDPAHQEKSEGLLIIPNESLRRVWISPPNED